MTIEVTPFGVACNIGCLYCYQDPMRDAGNVVGARYDMAKMKAALKAEGGKFSLFGGEPLLLPLPDLEELFAFGLEQFASKCKNGENPNAIQTNGTLITAEHVALFRKYRVGIGISMDGPADLNDARWAGSEEKTRAMTAKSEAAVRLLLAEGLGPSLIVTLHRLNAAPDRLPRLEAWFRDLDAAGLRSARLHLLEVDHPARRERFELGVEETIEVFLRLSALEPELRVLRFDVFTDIERLLAGEDGDVTCTFNACDPLTTHAVHGVDGQGQRTNCGRTNKEGVAWRKADVAGFERQLALHATPQEHGGCAGCRFFFACKGQCPGTAIGGDWRHRSDGCPLWMALFEEGEARMLRAGRTPLSRSAELPKIEERLLGYWAGGWHGSVRAAVNGETGPGGAGHGDSHGDTPHGDSPHVDGVEHADHTDAALLEAGSRERPLGVVPVGRPA